MIVLLSDLHSCPKRWESIFDHVHVVQGFLLTNWDKRQIPHHCICDVYVKQRSVKNWFCKKIKKIRILPLSYRTFFQKTFHVINTNILFVHRGKCFKVYTVEILIFIHLKLVDFFRNNLSSIYWTQVILVFWYTPSKCFILAADGISPFDMVTISSLRKGLFQVETERFF